MGFFNFEINLDKGTIARNKKGVHCMVTIVRGLVCPAWYALTTKEPTRGYYKASEHERHGGLVDAVVDPRNEFLGSLLATVVAVGEYFALSALMAQMPNTPTAVAAGFLFYRGIGSLLGYQTTDAAMSVWLAREIRPLLQSSITPGLIAFAATRGVLVASFFFHRFACIGEIKTPFIDMIHKKMNIPAFNGVQYAFGVVAGFLFRASSAQSC
jgi:hypothetical protein